MRNYLHAGVVKYKQGQDTMSEASTSTMNTVGNRLVSRAKLPQLETWTQKGGQDQSAAHGEYQDRPRPSGTRQKTIPALSVKQGQILLASTTSQSALTQAPSPYTTQTSVQQQDFNSVQRGGSRVSSQSKQTQDAQNGINISIQPQTRRILSQLQATEPRSQKLLDFFQANALLDLSFSISSQQLQRALQVVNCFPRFDHGTDDHIYNLLPEAFRDHLRSALFLIHKCMQQKHLSFQQISVSHPEDLLIQLTRLLPIKGDPELSLNLLKTILSLLEKFEKINKALPVAALRQSKLIEQLVVLIYESMEVMAGEVAKSALSVMIQISYLCPNEFTFQQIQNILRLCEVPDHLEDLLRDQKEVMEKGAQGFQGSERPSYKSTIRTKIQEQSIKLICNLLTEEEAGKKVINEDQSGLIAIFYCILSKNRNAIKFGLGSILNYTQVYQKSGTRTSKLISPFDLIGESGGLYHIKLAMSRSLDSLDYESILYGVKILINLSQSHELVFVAAEAGFLDQLCQVVQRLRDGVKEGQRDQKYQRYSKVIVNDAIKAIDRIACNQRVQYNKIVLIEKSQFLETFRQLLESYLPEIEQDLPSQVSGQILSGFYEIIELQVRGVYRFSKQVHEFADNAIIKLTKRLLLGPESDSELPSPLMLNSQTLPTAIFQFVSSLAESGLTEVSHFISVLDVQRYHQTNLREIGGDLSKVIIRTQTLLDNPIPMKMNELELEANLNQEKVQRYRDALQRALRTMAERVNTKYQEQVDRENRQGGRIFVDKGDTSGSFAGGGPRPSSLAMTEDQDERQQQSDDGQQSREEMNIQDMQARDQRHPASQVLTADNSAYDLQQAPPQRLTATPSRSKSVFQPYIPSKPEKRSDSSVLTYEQYLKMDESDRKAAKERGARSGAGSSRGGNVVPGARAKTPMRKIVIKDEMRSAGGTSGRGTSQQIVEDPGGSVTHSKGRQNGQNGSIEPSRNSPSIRAGPGTSSAISRHSSHNVINKYTNSHQLSNTITYHEDYESNLKPKGNHGGRTVDRRNVSNPRNMRLEPLPPQPNGSTGNAVQLDAKTQKMVYPLNRRNIEILENMNNAASILKAQPNQPGPQKSLNYLESQSQRIIINSNPTGGPNPLSSNNPALPNSTEDGAGVSQGPLGLAQIPRGMSSGPLSLHNADAAEVQSTRPTLQSRGSTMVQGGREANRGSERPQYVGYTQGHRKVVPAKRGEGDDADYQPTQITEQHQQPNNEYYKQELNKNAINPFPSLWTSSGGREDDDRDADEDHLGSQSNNNQTISGKQPHNNSALDMELYPIQEEDPKEIMGSSFTVNHQKKVQQNQMIIAQRDRSNQRRPTQNEAGEEQLAKKQLISEVDLADYDGQERQLVQRYLDADLLNKDLADSKNARSSLGIGMPEVRAIHKRMKLPKYQGGAHIKTFREYIEWYRSACEIAGSYGAHVDLQKCVCSSQRTAKIIALVRLAAIQLGQPIE